MRRWVMTSCERGCRAHFAEARHAERVSVQAPYSDRAAFDETRKGAYSTLMMKRVHTTIQLGRHAMPKKIQFEWELPDALVDALTPGATEVTETIKAAAVLDWVRTHKLSLRRGAEL